MDLVRTSTYTTFYQTLPISQSLRARTRPLELTSSFTVQLKEDAIEEIEARHRDDSSGYHVDEQHFVSDTKSYEGTTVYSLSYQDWEGEDERLVLEVTGFEVRGTWEEEELQHIRDTMKFDSVTSEDEEQKEGMDEEDWLRWWYYNKCFPGDEGGALRDMISVGGHFREDREKWRRNHAERQKKARKKKKTTK